ncbi:docking domain of Afi1 for Arf3 in vesicle trafficking-domain-containing protein [Rhodocollybia butyracea]|uniref:Docking domain of Afi1 for Arf3 in vesicle trafficking-domain-containing protein n=1 Tax=Rhodocollybia butyracea TaxID=206335 RepID=A0A9P5PSW8_9AGAR|nr:docking domain of Afi1 for Arf3 in vesicle trafficking-domain-containing protein [Rhodocollybia butyracea]
MASPANGNHCSFVLLAEFDIIEGAQLKYQFPQPLGVDESVLAMSMLPDGAETQLDDWTIFFLNQTAFNTIEPVLALETDSDSYMEEYEGQKKKKKDLLCVLNLVRTKHDKTLDRGAKVLALAICTRHPFIQIFKPVLLIALDDYLLNPSQDVLTRLFDAVNAIDFSAAPVLSRDEKLVMRMSERKDIFAEKHKHIFPHMSTQTLHKSTNSDTSQERLPSSRSNPDPDSNPSVPGDVSFGSAVWVGDESAFDLSSVSDGDDTTDGGSTVIGSNRQRSSTDASSNSSSSHLHLPRIPIARTGSSYGSYESNHSGTKVGSSYMGTGIVHDTHFFNTTVEYNDHKLPIKMPLATFGEEVGDYSLITLIRTFSQPTSSSSSSSSTLSSHSSPVHPHLHTSGPSTHPIIVLFNALVTGKNIIFLGHKRPAGEVSLFVLAACALGSGCGAVLRGFVERAFPYANLNNKEEWEGVPAYIAGVTNPIFETSRSWDILCDISTGTVTVSKDIWLKWPVGPGVGIGSSGSGGGLIAPLLTRTGTLKAEAAINDDVSKDGQGKGDSKYAADLSGVNSADNIFIEDIKTAIEFHYGESLVRIRFMEYVMRFVRLASRYEEETPSFNSTSETDGPKTRIGYPTTLFKDGFGGGALGLLGQLGSGLVFTDESLGIRELVANAHRIEGWRGTNSYRYYAEDFSIHVAQAPIRKFDVLHQIYRLRHAGGVRKISDAEAYAIMRSLADSVKEYDQVVELLSYLFPHSGGLLPLAFGLFHQKESVRDATVDLFDQLRAYPVGVLFLQSLNHFQRYAYVRLAHAREVKEKKQEQQHYSNQPYSTQPPYASQPYSNQAQQQYAAVPFGRTHSNSSASMSVSYGSPMSTGLSSTYGESKLNGAY